MNQYNIIIVLGLRAKISLWVQTFYFMDIYKKFYVFITFNSIERLWDQIYLQHLLITKKPEGNIIIKYLFVLKTVRCA